MTLSFLKTQGTKVVNEQGEEVVLRGVGLGNWMLPEGYMWLFGETNLDRPRRIEAFFETLIGKKEADAFWESFYETYNTMEDVKKIAELGFNSVRLPISYRFIQDEAGNFIEKRLQMIDDFVNQCEAQALYVILDLHGAPGGQTGANIDDSENDFPELFTNRAYQLETIKIWKMFATKYRNRSVIAGYDLLNEPLPAYFNQFNPQLIEVYDELIAEIRAIDPEHIIILEGANWANDWSVFVKPYENVVLQAHKYWNNPDTESIQQFIDIANDLNSPVWIGETGENIPSWYVGSYQMLADQHIGWNLWPWKRMGSPRNPYTIKTPKNWDALIAHAKGDILLSKDEAKAILDEYLENIKLENCILNEEVINSVLKQAPLTIPAAYYNYEGAEASYHSEMKKEKEISFRMNDDIKISFADPASKAALTQKDHQLLTAGLCSNIGQLAKDSTEKFKLLCQTEVVEKLIQEIALKEKIEISSVEAYKGKYHYILKHGAKDYDHMVSELNLMHLNFWHSRTEEDILSEQLAIELYQDEWVMYDVFSVRDEVMDLVLNVMSDVDSQIMIGIQGQEIVLNSNSKGKSCLTSKIHLQKGRNTIKVLMKAGSAKISSVEVK